MVKTFQEFKLKKKKHPSTRKLIINISGLICVSEDFIMFYFDTERCTNYELLCKTCYKCMIRSLFY
jgi:hypothetical protein